MKKLVALILALALACAAMSAVAETVITINGTGQTNVPADTAVVTLGVNVCDPDVVKAQTAVNEKIEAIRAHLVEAGFGEDNINTDRLHIYAMYDFSGEVQEIRSYNASSYLAIRTKDMDSVGKIIDIAFENGANMLDGINFSAENTEEAEKESMIKAVEEAAKKAQIIAAAAGLKITGIKDIHEGNSYSYDSGVNAFYKTTAAGAVEDAEMEAGTLVQAAKISVSYTVTVIFTAE